jgi:hypothetical protein
MDELDIAQLIETLPVLIDTKMHRNLWAEAVVFPTYG